MLISRRGRLRLADGRCGAQQLTSTDYDRFSNFFNRSFISQIFFEYFHLTVRVRGRTCDNRQIVWILNSVTIVK
jgi:hypothetical protein